MKIGIDLDNVLNNMNEIWLELYNKDYNDSVTVDDIVSWDIHKYVSIGKEIYNYLNDFLFYRLTPLHNSVKITERLSKNHELFVVTATPCEQMRAKKIWLKHYFPYIPEENIIPTARKDMVNVDVLIDDAPHNIESFPRYAIVFDKPWNRVKFNNNVVERAHGWSDIPNIIRRFEKREVQFKKY